MLGEDFRMSLAIGELLCRKDGFLRFFGVLVDIHDSVCISYCAWGPTPTRSRSGARLRRASLRPLARAAGAFRFTSSTPGF
jgi:hypothetical protein